MKARNSSSSNARRSNSSGSVMGGNSRTEETLRRQCGRLLGLVGPPLRTRRLTQRLGPDPDLVAGWGQDLVRVSSPTKRPDRGRDSLLVLVRRSTERRPPGSAPNACLRHFSGRPERASLLPLRGERSVAADPRPGFLRDQILVLVRVPFRVPI